VSAKDKDIAEKKFESFDDVFAAIVNAFFAMRGIKDRVDPKALENIKPRTSYKSSDDEVREQERDVIKLWKRPDGETVICLVGLENQSSIDKYMSLRVMSYEGADYRAQLPVKPKGPKPHFVITLVLYFGVKRRWQKDLSLHEVLNVPEQYRQVVNDVKLNVIELAWLSDEQEKLFKNGQDKEVNDEQDKKVKDDAYYLVHMLGQIRRGEDITIPPVDTLEHLSDFLYVLEALVGSKKYKVILDKNNPEQGGNIKMRYAKMFEAVRQEGRIEGRNEGRIEGRNEGRDEGRIEGRDEACIAIRARLIAGGMSPKEADKYVNPILAGAN